LGLETKCLHEISAINITLQTVPSILIHFLLFVFGKTAHFWNSHKDLIARFRFWRDNRELKQPRRRRQQKAQECAYLTMKNSIFARFARAFFSFWHYEVVFYDVKWPVLQLRGRHEHMMRNVQFCLLMSQALVQN